jgi:uracil-DNA glycosylase family 4
VPKPRPVGRARYGRRHPDNIWRGVAKGVDRAGRRTTGRCRGYQGTTFCRPGRAAARPRLDEPGIDRSAVYVTNAVKHSKFVPRGKRRIHQKPNSTEIRACHPWLEQELALIEPELVVALGATAAQAIFGKATPVGASRGSLRPGERCW